MNLWLRQFDWVLLGITSLLTSIGFAAIYSVDLSRGGSDLSYVPVQAIALGIGLVLCFAAARTHMNVYRLNGQWIYLFGLLLLIGVLIFGVSIRGTRGWFRIAGFSFQPAEFAKIALVLGLGWLIARYGRQFKQLRFVVASGLVTALPVGLIFLQPDLGSALVLVLTWGGLLLMTGVRLKHLIVLALSGLTVAICAWLFLLQPYQKDRIATFLNPAADPLGAGYNVTQSIIAIGSGQFSGRGLGFGSQSQLRFLPEAQTDFIFSVVAEELGFIGAFVLISLFFALLVRLVHIARNSTSEFGSYVSIGIAFLFFVQFIFNVGGTLGLLPITGVTLPFVSYGGSSLIINFVLIGIAESIAHASKSEIPYTIQ